jgi:hypothetical protein
MVGYEPVVANLLFICGNMKRSNVSSLAVRDMIPGWSILIDFSKPSSLLKL